MSRAGAIVGIIAVTAAASCGSDRAATPEPVAPASEQPLLVAAAGDREPVAQVNGVPIYDDCVATQAAALQLDRRAALDHCIDFELLAQAAQQRGKRADPDVAEARKVERVRRLLDDEFVARFSDPASTDRKLLERAYKMFHRRYNRPELRKTYFARSATASDVKGSPEDRAAAQVARDIHRALAGKRVTIEQFSATARRVAGDRPIEFGTYDGAKHRAVRAYANAAFAVPDAGMISEPARTRWGWDVIFIIEITEATTVTVDQEPARTELFTFVRRAEYLDWTKRLSSGASIEINDAALAALQASEQALLHAGEPR